MLIVEDTRQKVGKHEAKHEYWDKTGTAWARQTLLFGDYWAAPRIAIDTKQDIQEVVANMCGSGREKARFRRECQKAQAAGCKLIFLIEDKRYNVPEDLLGTKIYILNGQTIPGDQAYLAMKMHEERYGVEFWFCDPAESGRVIKELLEEWAKGTF